MLDGYAYTPNYSNDQIDANKARKKTDDIKLDLSSYSPEIYSAYEKLIDECERRLQQIDTVTR
jgi:hypothetical protein